MFLLDTNHCSMILDGDATVIARLQENSGSSISTSVVTEGELAYMSAASKKELSNSHRVNLFLAGLRIYSITSQTARIYGKLKADIFARFGPKEKAKLRHTSIHQLGFSDNDLWIASIALEHGLTVVSNDGDFVRIQSASNLKVVDWGS